MAGGYRYQTHPDMAPFVERFAMEGVSSRLSSAALETLAIVAYRQPVSRAQIAALRGVNVDGVVRLLEQRGYIDAVGHAPGPGQPVLYGTTPAFLEKLGLASSTSSRRWRSSCPAPRSWSNSRSACAPAPMPDGRDPPRRRPTRPGRHRRPRRASGCRRCWPAWGSAAGGPARS